MNLSDLSELIDSERGRSGTVLEKEPITGLEISELIHDYARKRRSHDRARQLMLQQPSHIEINIIHITKF